MIDEFIEDGLKHISIENENTKAVFLPEIGGKMIKLINKETGSQFLLDNQSEDKRYKPAYHGADFSKYDTSGFDECFPTVSAVDFELNDQNGNHKICFPDHGELWSREWDYHIYDDSVTFFVSGVNADYELRKRVTLDNKIIRIEYKVTNNSDDGFNFIWSAHPLLKVSEGSRLILPPEINKILLNWSSDNEIGNFGEYLKWPFLYNNGKHIDFTTVQKPELKFAIKGFSDLLNEGYAGLYNNELDETILFTFDHKKVPYLGLWLCYGGWPVDQNGKHYTVGLEPASGRPDSLEEAIKRNEAFYCEGKSEVNWELDLSVWKGCPDVNDVFKSLSSKFV